MNKSRFHEASTWAGIGLILTSIAAVPSPATPFLVAAAGVCGGIAYILRDGKPA